MSWMNGSQINLLLLVHRSKFSLHCFQFGYCTGRSEVSEDPESLSTAGVGSLNTLGQIHVHSPYASVKKNNSTLPPPSFPEGKMETPEILNVTKLILNITKHISRLDLEQIPSSD